MSDSLQPHGVYSPWNSPGQNTGVGSLSLLQIFLTQGLNPGLPNAGRFFTSWITGEAPKYWNGWPILSPEDHSNPGIELGSFALKVDSLPTELWEKPYLLPSRETEGGCGNEPSGTWQRSWGIEASLNPLQHGITLSIHHLHLDLQEKNRLQLCFHVYFLCDFL